MRPWLAVLALFSYTLAVPVGNSADAGKTPKRQTWEEYMTVDLNARVEELPPPADADARRKAFAERNSPESVERAAKELFALWDFGEGRASRNPMTQGLDAEKAKIRKLYEAKKYEEALKAYRSYLIRKTNILWNTKPNFASRDFNERFNSPVVRKRYEDTVALLLQDRFQTPTTKTTVRLGEPGLVHWEWKAKEVQNPWDNLKRPEIEYFSGSDFDRLWWKFVDTKDRKYLDRWLALLDDYCLNHHLQEDLSSLNLDLGKQGVFDGMGFLGALCEISRATPEGEDVVPPATVARMMAKQAAIIVPQSLFYNRQQSNNHSPGTTATFMRLSEFLYDFKIARTIEWECRRQFENYGTLEARPDGVGPGRLPMYALFEYKENQPFLQKIREEEYEWFTPQLNREYRDRMLLRGRFMLAMYAPNGELIVTQKTDRHGGTFSEQVAYYNRTLPELFDEPAMLKLASRIVRNQTAATWNGRVYQAREKPIARMGMGSPADDEPEFASQSFPFDRIHILSSGWDPKNDQYGVFLGSTVRGYGDSFMKENKACNHFNICAFDQDFFNNGVDYAYNYLRSPLTVDGQTQFNGAGEGPTSRRGGGNYGLDPICQDRIHYGPAFDVVEGFYDGAYANTGDHNPDYYDYRNKLEALKRCIRGCSHRRVICFVKKHGLWVVTDLMKSDKPHEYAQQWWVAKKSKQLPEGFLEEQIQASAEKQVIKTTIADKPNLSVYHVGPADLDKQGATIGGMAYAPVQLKQELEDTFKGSRADRLEGREYIELKGSWKSQGGRSQVITVLYPRKTVEDELVSLTPLKREDGQLNGFTATLKDGAEVTYVASLEKPEPVRAGDMQAVAEAVLVLKEADGKLSGAVLGCKELKAGNLTRPCDDFEFAVSGAQSETSPIYRPIEPVVVKPEQNVFVDKIEVSLTTPTEGTEIRYTVDQSDPTMSSRLYTGPVTFTSSVMVKARAFRKGLKKPPPPTATGTEMTGVSCAVFTQDEYHEPNTWTKDAKPGLNFDYCEAKWPFLLFGPNTSLKPLKQGNVPALFDTSPKGDNKDRAFAFLYDGYLNVPEDGVYSIYAPKEFAHYRPLAGYDLSVWLGYQTVYYDGKKQKLSGGSPRNMWYPATRRHAFGTWSIALKKGLQPFRVYYADIRPGGTLQYLSFEYPGWNVPGLTKIIWDGDAPQLEIAGPGIQRQPIPAAWLCR
ncbi:MAG: chitobiase/beta-hexosaminidase C-terminal domain-containing protein [Planctomycetota bacterium]|nr:chitobiase/beta-hexosaminidase C-terminal domain-containing protein [Planctomycetota bacterium]